MDKVKGTFFYKRLSFYLPSSFLVLYVKNLATCVSEDLVSQTFAAFGEIEKVKKLKGGSWGKQTLV